MKPLFPLLALSLFIAKDVFTPSVPQERVVQPKTVAEAETVFSYDLNKGQVPRLYLASLPADLPKIAGIDKKKQMFIRMLLPVVLKQNEQVLADRQEVMRLQDKIRKGLALRGVEEEWLEVLAAQYKCSPRDFKTLLVRVDEIPPSLALAQAIIETGWGTSKAALKKNSPFGHMATPNRVAQFRDIPSSVYSYVKNLNSNRAYDKIHKARASFRSKGKKPLGTDLVHGLHKYSVRGHGYVREVKSLIQRYKLEKYDHVTLKEAP